MKLQKWLNFFGKRFSLNAKRSHCIPMILIKVPISARKEWSCAGARMRLSAIQSDECRGGKLLISDGRSRISPVAAVITRSSRAFQLKLLFFPLSENDTWCLSSLMNLHARFDKDGRENADMKLQLHNGKSFSSYLLFLFIFLKVLFML